MKAEEIKLKITGTRRLIMHAGRLADPLDPITKNLAKLTAKRAKTEADAGDRARASGSAACG